MPNREQRVQLKRLFAVDPPLTRKQIKTAMEEFGVNLSDTYLVDWASARNFRQTRHLATADSERISQLEEQVRRLQLCRHVDDLEDNDDDGTSYYTIGLTDD